MLSSSLARIDPGMKAKRPAVEQGPDLYLEPKWLRCSLYLKKFILIAELLDSARTLVELSLGST